MALKRRKFTAQFKFETVMEVLRGEKSVTQICQEHDITETLCYKWRDAFFERAPSVFENQRGGKTGYDGLLCINRQKGRFWRAERHMTWLR